MAIMEVVLETNYASQRCINRWNYIGSGTPAAVTRSFALASALGAIPSVGVYPTGSLMWKIALMIDDGVTFVNLTVKDVYSPTDFYTAPFVEPLAGQNAGVGLSPLDSYGFFSNRVRSDVRRGTKRFTGVITGHVQQGGVIVSGAITLMNAVAQEMSDTQVYVDEGNNLTFVPAIVSKLKYQSNSDPVRFAYRYYSTEALQLEHVAEGILWDEYPNTRSQGSRQYGHGA